MCDGQSGAPLNLPRGEPDAGDVARALLDWYARCHRDLPWRRTSDPYAIWVSEVMLQQTQVSTAVSYYERFLHAFPTVHELANAALDDVLAVWQGLGYYARARNLHAAARIVAEKYGGRLPRARRALEALPGVGPYIAGALLSIAFGQDEVAVDANATRVLTRLYDFGRDPSTSAGRCVVTALAQCLLPTGRAREFNAAMMELGATVCTPARPRCASCPVTGQCLARRRGTQEQRPARKPKREVPTRSLVVAVCRRQEPEGGDCVLIVRRAPAGLLGGMWELPSAEVLPDRLPEQALEGTLRDHLGLRVETRERLAEVRHAYSHFRVRAGIYACRTRGKAEPHGPWDAAHWLAPDEEADYGLTRLTTKALEVIGWPPDRRPSVSVPWPSGGGN